MTADDESRRWLDAAGEDLDFSRYAADGEFFAQACFHAQQAAEKAVKASHYAAGARVVIGHSVRNLIERLEPRDPALDALVDDARELDLLYVPTRYPNGLDEGTPGAAFSKVQAERAMELAGAVCAAVSGRLS